MRKKILALALGLLFTMPYVLHADEVEITLLEVVGLSSPGGDNPLDGSTEAGTTPTRPNDFRAVRDGNTLSIIKQNEDIPSARAIVVRSANGSIVLNQQFAESLSEPIATSGVYVLRIETDGGALVGQFMVP